MHNPESTWFGTKPVTPGQKPPLCRGCLRLWLTNMMS